MVHILMSPDGKAYVRLFQKIDGHWVVQSVQEIKTLKELQEWQAQQCDEFIERTTPDGSKLEHVTLGKATLATDRK